MLCLKKPLSWLGSIINYLAKSCVLFVICVFSAKIDNLGDHRGNLRDGGIMWCSVKPWTCSMRDMHPVILTLTLTRHNGQRNNLSMFLLVFCIE